MRTLVDYVAEVVYDRAQPLPWEKALDEDRDYYSVIAEIVLDTVATQLEEAGFDVAAEYIVLDAERARQARLAS